MDFSPDGCLLAVGYRDTTRVYRVDPGRSTRQFEQDDPVWGLDLSPDGRRLATLSHSAVRIWEVETGRLVRHPLPWGIAAVGWAVLQLGLLVTPRQNLIAFAITLGQYGLLIGAGWFGWQRPWLFGTAAGIFGVVFHAVIAGIVTIQAGEDASAALAVVGSLSALLLLYGLVGAFAGFYGGYLRRRMAAQSAATTRGKRR